MRKFNSLIALILIGNFLFADITELASTGLSAGTPYFRENSSSSRSLSNPALTSDIQRYTFDLSYLLLTGFGGAESGMGHSISLGGALPTKYGVLSSNVDFLLTNSFTTSNLKIGNGSLINFNFSKDLYTDLSFGAGITTILGSDSTGFDWGLGLNLGITKEMGSIHSLLNDFRWGFSINNLGKPYKSSLFSATSAYPTFTPIGFVEFSPYKSDNLYVDVSTELAFPSFSDINFEVGAKAVAFNDFVIDTTTNVNLRELIDGDRSSLIPSLFFGYKMNIRDDLATLSLAANQHGDGVWSIGAGGTLPIGEKDTNPPVLEIDYNSAQYISPNFDGIQDELNVPVKVTDERYIQDYEMIIRDSFGKIVKRVVNKEERPENESIQNLFSILISPKTGVPVPESFRWDGKMDDGKLVPDGKYYFAFKFSDDNGNSVTSDRYTFIVDNTPPVVDVSTPTGLDLIFSPNGDGNKDVFTIPQTGSKEVRWYGEITDLVGNTIKSRAWDNRDLTDFVWDGKDNSGQLVPDGVYHYKISSTDLAGNSVSEVVDNIIINTKQPPIGINIDTNSFSPNNDGVKDHMEFVLDIPVKTGIINWVLNIKNSRGEVVNSYSTEKMGYSVIEDIIRFDGKNESGEFLDEGLYKGTLSVKYQNGHSPVIDSPEFSVDVTAPSANVVAQYPMFSPNGDNSKDVIIFNQKSSKELEWNGSIFNEFGKPVLSVNWKGDIDSTFEWDGKNDNGELQEDGRYLYVLTSTDKSGNSYNGNPVEFDLDTSQSNIELALSKTAFSPKGSGDSIDIKPSITSKVDLSDYTLDILDSSNRVVKTISKGKELTDSYKWFGDGQSGSTLKDGVYTARINAEFENGNKVVSVTPLIDLDTKAPSVDVTRKERFSAFSPNGDGQKDTITIIQKTSKEDTWVGKVLDSSNNEVFTTSWSGIAPSEFVFNGKDNSNKNLPDGVYTYTLSATDKAGNSGVSKRVDLEIDTEDVDLFVSTNLTHFSPNGDGVKDRIDFIPDLKKDDGIESATYNVLNSKGAVVYSRAISSNFGDTFTWDGKNSRGTKVDDGEYSVKLTVKYQRGDSPETSSNFIIDTVAPAAKVETENLVFSPNGDGNKDVVGIRNISSDNASWVLGISDSKGNSIKSESVKGLVPAEWNFDGRGKDLSILENGNYYYTLYGEDEAGNKYNSSRVTIELDNSVSSLVVSNDLSVFSPNNDKIKDRITFTSRIEASSPIESWELSIENSKKQVVKKFTGTSQPRDLVWDGKSDSGKIVEDGIYKGIMKVLHKNGNNPSSSTSNFELDTIYPEINLSAENRLFSPDGDNLKDYVILTQSASGEDLYRGTIYNTSNELVKEWFWKNRLPSFNWNGEDASGNISSDGNYYYIVETTDKGGNRTSKRINDIRIDTSDTDIFITYKKAAFAPDLANSLGGQIFGLIVNNKNEIDSWSIKIENGSTLVKEITGGSVVPDSVEWNGKDSRGLNTNGELTAKFNVVYKKGNSPVYSTKEFLADSDAPRIKVETNPTPFSPDNDFVDDELEITIGVRDLSDIESWEFAIKDPKGNDFISFQGEGTPGNKIIWDGKSSNGELVQAAEEYPYVMSVKDAAGHVGVIQGEIPVDILVIKEGDKLKIKVSSIIFAPDSANLDAVGKNGESNSRILTRLSEILKKYSTYKIEVEGHANNIYGSQISRAQRNSLIDFSRERAEAVKESLVELGIGSSRMTTIGIGGDQPVVSFGDVENAWKNRRVEFVLVK